MKSKNGDNAIILGIKAGFVFLLFGLITSASGSSVFAIDYYEITNPKFVPVNVGLITDSSSEVETVQNVFKSNLEKVLYFQIINGTKKEFAQSEEVLFQLALALKKNPDQLRITLWTQANKTPVSQELFALEDVQDLRKTGLKLADWFVEKTGAYKYFVALTK